MPVVCCEFCEFEGEGDNRDAEFDSVEDHELAQHRKEMVEFYGEEYVKELESEI